MPRARQYPAELAHLLLSDRDSPEFRAGFIVACEAILLVRSALARKGK